MACTFCPLGKGENSAAMAAVIEWRCGQHKHDTESRVNYLLPPGFHAPRACGLPGQSLNGTNSTTTRAELKKSECALFPLVFFYSVCVIVLFILLGMNYQLAQSSTLLLG